MPDRRKASVRKRVLLVDDCEGVLRAYRRRLRAEGLDVAIACGVAAARLLLRTNVFDWVVVDLMMPAPGERNLTPIGLDLVEEIRQIAPSSGIVLMTAYPSFEAAARAGRLDTSIQWFLKTEPIADLVALVAMDVPLRHEIAPPDEATRVRERYLTALVATGGNYTEAASRLHVSR
mgnify:FL=1